ncbi:hypothetical protein GCM10023347_13660 [Streptomyces chumphonensis]
MTRTKEHAEDTARLSTSDGSFLGPETGRAVRNGRTAASPARAGGVVGWGGCSLAAVAGAAWGEQHGSDAPCVGVVTRVAVWWGGPWGAACGPPEAFQPPFVVGALVG